MKSVATWPHYPLTATRFTSADIAIYIGHQPQVGWRFVVKQEDYRQVGPIYATKAEILADLPRYAGTWANEWKEENSMTPTEQKRAARQEWLRKGGEDFAALCLHGAYIGTDGTFINLTVESKYLRDSAVLGYQQNIAARQKYYNSLGQAVHRDVGSTCHIDYITNTAGQFVLSTTECAFLEWQENQQAVATMLDENQIPESEFTQAEQAAIHSMRSKGFAVAVFTPKELASLDEPGTAAGLEERMVAAGNDYISFYEMEQ